MSKQLENPTPWQPDGEYVAAADGALVCNCEIAWQTEVARDRIITAVNSHDALTASKRDLIASIRKMMMYAGDLDASRGCRHIIAEGKEALKNAGVEL